MKVNLELSPEYTESYVVVYTDRITEEVQRVLDFLDAKQAPVVGQLGEKLRVLKPEEIYMARTEGGDVILYGEKERYVSRKRLYEIEQQLGNQFLRISKSTLVNLSFLDSVEAGFNGTLLLKLKNGCKDYVSRKYLKTFKTYLGL